MIGIYTRISGNKEDGKDTSIEIQTELGIAFAKRIGLPYKVYTDIGISGAKDEIEDRPEFALLLNDIKKDIITGVWVLEQARLERSPSVWQLFQLIAIDKETKYYPNSV
jgi:DNA invertase Pin-like site-specific DNA recombinase